MFEVFALLDVVADCFGEIDFFTFGNFGVSVAREVDETPCFVHDEKVKEPSFSGRGGYLCKVNLVG